MNSVIVIGAGGHARVLIETLQLSGEQVLFATETVSELFGRTINGVAIRGTDAMISDCSPQDVLLAIGIGSVSVSEKRRDIFQHWTDAGYRFIEAIHPSAIVSPTASIGSGAQVFAGAVLQANCQIGENSLINTSAAVDHDAVIGPHSHVGPGGTICGEVTVGVGCHIGAGATIMQGVSIGDQSLVGAGAVVTSNLPPRSKVVGVPARPLGR